MFGASVAGLPLDLRPDLRSSRRKHGGGESQGEERRDARGLGG